MKEFSAAIPFNINQELTEHLIIGQDQEELTFALWTPSEGKNRLTAMITEVILPNANERYLHGNVSFSTAYFKRACKEAMEKKCGIALLHSHPGDGWQDMSRDDIKAELKLSTTCEVLTAYPLVGLTVSQDYVWSARVWNFDDKKHRFKRQWATSVRIVGAKFNIFYADGLNPAVDFQEHFKRTATVWGKENHKKLTRLKIGIIGLGSVGSIIAESLARMGMQNLTLIDYDRVETHNLDRLLGAIEKDLGKYKVEVTKMAIKKSATAKKIEIKAFPTSISKEDGYNAALDCDILFSCVDKPRARYIQNHIAYNHLIPVIDGGIQVRLNENGEFLGAEWQIQTVCPDNICLECLSAYDPFEVELEKNGLLEDPTYIKGLPESEQRKRNENIFPFSCNLASLEIFQFLNYVIELAYDNPIQRFDFNNGHIRHFKNKSCKESCYFASGIAQGDKHYQVYNK